MSIRIKVKITELIEALEWAGEPSGSFSILHHVKRVQRQGQEMVSIEGGLLERWLDYREKGKRDAMQGM